MQGQCQGRPRVSAGSLQLWPAPSEYNFECEWLSVWVINKTD